MHLALPVCPYGPLLLANNAKQQKGPGFPRPFNNSRDPLSF